MGRLAAQASNEDAFGPLRTSMTVRYALKGWRGSS